METRGRKRKLNVAAKLYELKRGERFYNWECLIVEMIECWHDPNNPDWIKYAARHFKTGDIITLEDNGTNVRDQMYYRYTGRDRSSFNAGFMATLRLTMKYMQIFDLENAGLEHSIQQYITMSQLYQKWLKNEDKLW